MHHIIVQRAVSPVSVPTNAKLKKWAKIALDITRKNVELVIRIVDKDEITLLNATYRKKNKPTNVLSFPFEMPSDIELPNPILGDIVICADVVLDEAKEQNKSIEAHWAHMIVHGVLHLQGFDHENDKDAEVMEKKEILILKELGFDNPYYCEEGKK